MKGADIVITAVGKGLFFTNKYFNSKSIVIDVGISRLNLSQNKKIVGDVDFDNVKNNVKAITPVPGGIGPMTVSYLMKNCLIAYNLQNKNNL